MLSIQLQLKDASASARKGRSRGNGLRETGNNARPTDFKGGGACSVVADQ